MREVFHALRKRDGKRKAKNTEFKLNLLTGILFELKCLFFSGHFWGSLEPDY